MRDDDLARIYLEEDFMRVEDKQVKSIFGVSRRENLYVPIRTLESLKTTEVNIETVYGELPPEQLKILVDNIEWVDDEQPEINSVAELFEKFQEAGVEYAFELKTGLQQRVKVVGIRGYCQGDMAYVLLQDDEPVDSTYLENIFFNQPIYARMTINIDDEDETEHEFHLHESLQDAYEYDKKVMIEKAMEAVEELTETQQKEVLRFLTHNLPESL